MGDPVNPMLVEEDFIPRREPKPFVPMTQEEIDADVAYFLKNLYAALKIPKELQGHEQVEEGSVHPRR